MDRVEFEKMILNKLTKAISEEFTDMEVIEMYNDQTPQHFEKPCIVVLEYDTTEDHLLNNMVEIRVYFDILIHVEFDSTNLKGIYTTMRNYSPRISRAINYLTFEATYTHNRKIKLRKSGYRSFVEGNIGHCMVDYKFYATMQDENTLPPITNVRGESHFTQE